MRGGSGKCGVGVGVFKIPLPHHHSVSPTPTPDFHSVSGSTPRILAPLRGAAQHSCPLQSTRNDWIWSTSAGLRLRRLRTGGSWVVLHYTCREQLAPHQRCNCPLRLETKELCPLQTAIVVWCHSKLGLYSATLPSTPYLIIIHTNWQGGGRIWSGPLQTRPPFNVFPSRGGAVFLHPSLT